MIVAVPLCLVPQRALWGELTFAAQVALPAILLLTLSGVTSVDFRAVRRHFGFIVVPLMAALFYHVTSSNASGEEVLAYFNENPFHTVAQVVAKAGVLFYPAPLFAAAMVMVGLGVLNVRSALLGYALGLIWVRARSFGSVLMLVVGLGIFVLTLMVLTGQGLDDFASRLVERNRSEYLDRSLDSFSSGRIGIWAHYVDEIATRSSPLNLMFGSGAVWLYHDPITGVRPYRSGAQELAAHNDILNIVVCYGILGLAALTAAWAVILARLEPPFRGPAIILFTTLFLTNGVVFHQSNVLFMLFFQGARRGSSAPSSRADEPTHAPWSGGARLQHGAAARVRDARSGRWRALRRPRPNASAWSQSRES
jgi:hypothetical protein